MTGGRWKPSGSIWSSRRWASRSRCSASSSSPVRRTAFPGAPLILGDLVAHARQLQPTWLRAAFLFLLVGFGTKMGLAPMHTWKPDTYGEAPALVGGLMAGALTSCAFLGVARITEVAMAAGLGPFVQPVSDRLRPALARRRGRIRDRAGGPQAPARLLERRAHGPAGARPRTGWRGRVRHRAPPGEQRADEGLALSRRGQRGARHRHLVGRR